MNLNELEKQLIFEGYNPSCFEITDSTPSCDDCYVLLTRADGFKIGYQERGSTDIRKEFKNETEACENFYNELKSAGDDYKTFFLSDFRKEDDAKIMLELLLDHNLNVYMNNIPFSILDIGLKRFRIFAVGNDYYKAKKLLENG